MAKADLILRSDQRVFFVGKTGSGKSFLARWLLRRFKRLIVIDPKISPSIDRWRLDPFDKDGIKALRDGEPARLRVFNPPSIDAQGFPVWDAIFELAWDVADVCVYIDEMGSVAKNGLMTYPLRRIYTQGREHGVGVWAATQRPSHVPLEMFGEAEWGFMFMLKMEQDRKRIAGATGYDRLLEPIRDVHGFYVYYETWQEPTYYERFEPGDEQFIETDWKQPTLPAKVVAK